MANAIEKLRTGSWIQSKEMVLRRKEPFTGSNLLRDSNYFSLNQGVNRDKCPQTRPALASFCPSHDLAIPPKEEPPGITDPLSGEMDLCLVPSVLWLVHKG